MRGAVVGGATLTIALAAVVSGAAYPGQAQALPPSWTPAPTWTLEPTLPIPTLDIGFPTATPIPALTPLKVEKASLFAPLFFLSKSGSATVYMARTDPNAT